MEKKKKHRCEGCEWLTYICEERSFCPLPKCKKEEYRKILHGKDKVSDGKAKNN